MWLTPIERIQTNDGDTGDDDDDIMMIIIMMIMMTSSFDNKCLHVCQGEMFGISLCCSHDLRDFRNST
jgi:hypothetical protein